ncbi:hypothetical protein [Rhodopirellula bahusiensis]|uniref:hypothetical protein n=1 Tax=Rhodopirellula bahusiensis TaxID=2014065 RepID=UPI003264DAA7
MTDWHRKLSKLQLTLIIAQCCWIFAWSVQDPIAFPFSLHIVFISAFVGWVLAVIFNQGLRHRRSLPEQTTDPEAPNMDGEGNEQQL